jgi:putative endonuclease
MRGQRAENLASDYLSRHGLRLQAKNYYCRYGEIDLVMLDDDFLVFVEVRHRSSNQFGGAIASVNANKQQKLRLTAEHYLLKHRLTNQACRFDLFCLDGDLNNPEINWLRNAF